MEELNRYEHLIIGAGPSGIGAAITLENKSKGILMLDSGRELLKRKCPVDNGKKCFGCGGICNVISGIGGIVSFPYNRTV